MHGKISLKSFFSDKLFTPGLQEKLKLRSCKMLRSLVYLIHHFAIINEKF